jgi:hypothetical protein
VAFAISLQRCAVRSECIGGEAPGTRPQISTVDFLDEFRLIDVKRFIKVVFLFRRLGISDYPAD